MRYRFFVITVLSFLTFHTNYIFAATGCERNLMDTYLVHRSRLLEVDSSSKAVLKTLMPNFQDNFSGNIKEYLIALRIREAKIIKLYEFSASCNSDGGSIKIKILYSDGEYDRLYITIKKYRDSYFLYSSSAEVASEGFDKDQQYEPVVLKDFVPATLK